MAKSDRKSRRARKAGKDNKPMLFDQQNYAYMFAGIMMVFIGFFGMWLESAVDGFFSLFISPLLVIGGFIVVAYGVLLPHKEETSNSSSSSAQD